jgi:NADH-quinone oxidoreductase subunit C
MADETKPQSKQPGKGAPQEASTAPAADGKKPVAASGAGAAKEPAAKDAGAGAAAKPAAAAKPRPKPKPKAPPEPPKAPEDQAPPDGMELPAVVTAVQNGVPGAVQQVSFWVGDWTIIIDPTRLLDVMRFLKDDAATAFDYCSDVTAADWPPREKRFDVIYCLYSTRLRHRLRVKARVGEEDPVESVTSLWPAADWLEREVYDQFGINIVNHPDRRRILMPDQWQGYPQRKDYPLEGPGELLMENPQDWLRVRNIPDEAGAGADAEIE